MHNRALRLYHRPPLPARRRYFDWFKVASYFALLFLLALVWIGVGFVGWLVFQ